MSECRDPRAVTASEDVLGESPTWDQRARRLYWVDLRRRLLRRLDPSSGAVEAWDMPEPIGAVVPRKAGGVVVALKTAIHAFDPAHGLTKLAEVDAATPQNRLNDAKCDAAGNLWCGSMFDFGLEVTGSLYRVDGCHRVQRVRGGVGIPNSIAFSADRRRLYFADSKTGVIEWTPCEAETGTIGAWSVLAAPDAAPGKPDGSTVDAEGFIWNARYGGACLARFAPDGRLDRLVPLPSSQPTSCAFGGEDLRTLYVTTATQKLPPAQLEQEPLTGALLALDVGVRGLPEPVYSG
jgi:sugar lactone lactonase YvrE